MSFTCPMCRKKWIITTKLCEECDKIRHMMEIYSPKKIIQILQKLLVVEQFKCENDSGDDTEAEDSK